MSPDPPASGAGRGEAVRGGMECEAGGGPGGTARPAAVVPDTCALVGGGLALLRALAEGGPGGCRAAFYGGAGAPADSGDAMGEGGAAAETAAGLRGARVLVPWAVLRELDGLKAGSGRAAFGAREAIRFLDEAFATGRVDGQTMVRARAAAVDHGDGSPDACPDDRVLQCALQERDGGAAVLLLTCDAGLRAKAAAHGLRAEPPPPGPEVLAALVCDIRASDLRPGEVRSSAGGGANGPVGEPPGSLRAEPEPRVVPALPLCGDWQGVAQEALGAVATAGGAFCQERFDECFGDEEWGDIVCCRAPWGAPEVLRILCKHWIAVFMEVLPRRGRDLAEQLARQEAELGGVPADAVQRRHGLRVLQLSADLVQVLGASPTPSRACRDACRRAEAQLRARLEWVAQGGTPSPRDLADARGASTAVPGAESKARAEPFRAVDRSGRQGRGGTGGSLAVPGVPAGDAMDIG